MIAYQFTDVSIERPDVHYQFCKLDDIFFNSWYLERFTKIGDL